MFYVFEVSGGGGGCGGVDDGRGIRESVAKPCSREILDKDLSKESLSSSPSSPCASYQEKRAMGRRQERFELW